LRACSSRRCSSSTMAPTSFTIVTRPNLAFESMAFGSLSELSFHLRSGTERVESCSKSKSKRER
jgi:hypothetical protein